MSAVSLAAAAPQGLTRPRAILFDWDNTLVDSWTTIHEALNAVMAAMEKPLWSLRETKERVRLSLRESFPLHFGERWEEARRIYLDVFRTIHLDRLRALPGRDELLHALVAEGIFLGVVSNKTGALLRCEAERIGWSELFGSVIGAGDAAQDKPNPAPVALALEPSGVEPGEGVLARRRHRHRHGVRLQQRLHSGFARQRSDREGVSPLRAAPCLPRWCVFVSLCAGLAICRRAPILIVATRGSRPSASA